mgnify:CR=1 FL=1
MKYLILSLFYLQAAHADPILLSIGESWKTKVPSVDVRVSKSTVIKARVMGSDLWISGKKSGESWVEWGSNKQLFIVLPPSELFSYRQLENFIMHRKG